MKLRWPAELPVNLIVEVPGVSVRLVTVVAVHILAELVLVTVPVRVQVPLPILSTRVPVPEMLTPVLAVIVGLLLLTLRSRMQPVVEAVHAPRVRDWMVGS